MKKKMIIGVLAAALLAGSANAETYECKVKARGPDFGWISKTLVFHIPFRFSKTTVENTLIKATGQTTVHADLSMYSKKRITLSWVLKGVLGRNGENLGKFTYRATTSVKGLKNDRHQTIPRWMYRLTILKARGNKAIVSAQAAGYFGSLGASGKCRVSK
ncbi:hypothetical protein [Profundibacter amoris]|uniref:DUF3108 domain-containing protein n=1 Tax=Profundibacter amoris TaxID=2171755 RepID=A0A347UFA0_9RHOB|nr:hypothetical protein [Profundibacter amoris]AXX97528.1 hypothetical protein BAR1_06005 [Profundibacter amoris]